MSSRRRPSYEETRNPVSDRSPEHVDGAGAGSCLGCRWRRRTPSGPGAWSPPGFTDTTQTASESLNGISAVAPDDVWAVGTRTVSDRDSTLVEHWDGTAWSVVPSPSPGGRPGSRLESVDAISANDVWAVGTYVTVGHQLTILVEHWNGTSWRRVATPILRGSSALASVSATSPTDIWAVGYRLITLQKPIYTLAMHWDGSTWSRVATPTPKNAMRGLLGVDSTGTASGWAVGYTLAASGGKPNALAERWNGRAWHQVAVPVPRYRVAELAGVSVVAPGNVWAVGSRQPDETRHSYALVEHFTGRHWHSVPVPGLGSYSSLSSVSGDAPDDVWAVGTRGPRDSPRSVLVHWDGRAWRVYGGPGAESATLNAVTTGGTTSTWAVGLTYRHGSAVPFEERWNGHVWTR